jgi:RNA polymerase sigma factor (sigma-70 family)
MQSAAGERLMAVEQNRVIAAAVRRERARLRAFIRRRVFDPGEAEDILQDVLLELVLNYRLAQPLDQIGSWLLRVARNRIIDLFRRRTRARTTSETDSDMAAIVELLPSPEAGPDATLAREALLEQLDEAIRELPPEQRAVFIAHEIDGVSFKTLAARWGVGVNTLLSRKHYAVLHLRSRLQEVYEDWQQE